MLLLSRPKLPFLILFEELALLDEAIDVVLVRAVVPLLDQLVQSFEVNTVEGFTGGCFFDEFLRV